MPENLIDPQDSALDIFIDELTASIKKKMQFTNIEAHDFISNRMLHVVHFYKDNISVESSLKELVKLPALPEYQ